MSNRQPSDGGPGSFELGDLLGQLAKDTGLDKPKQLDPIFEAWNTVAGPNLSAVAQPVRFRQRELSIDVSSASHYHELVAFTGEGLRKRLNETLGEERVKRLAFKHQVGT